MASSKPTFTLNSTMINFQHKNFEASDTSSTEKLTHKSEDRITNFTQLAVKLNRAALVFPGNISTIQDENRVILTLSPIRKVITYTFFGNIFYVILSGIFKSLFFSTQKSNALFKFSEDFQRIAWFFSYVIFLSVLSQPSRLANVINQMSRIERQLADSGFKPIALFYAKYLPRLVLGAYLAVNITCSLINVDSFVYIPKRWRSVAVFLVAKADARWSYLGRMTEAQAEAFDFGSNIFEVAFKMALGLFFTIFHLFFGYVEIFGNILASSMAFSSCLLVHTFRRGLKNREFQVPKSTVLQIAEDFVDLFEFIEDAVGWIFFYFCFACVPYFAFHVGDVAYGSWAEGSIYCCYAFTFCVMNFSAALCNPWLKYVTTWYRRQLGRPSGLTLASTPKAAFSSNDTSSTERRFDVLVQEMSVREIGIRGKMFTGTFSFFGQVCGLVITYAVLWYQLKAE